MAGRMVQVANVGDAQGLAAKIAAALEWDCDGAIAIAYELLEECNCHTEAAALKAATEEYAERNDIEAPVL